MSPINQVALNNGNFHLSIADLSIIVASLVAVLLVGWWASRRQDRTSAGYFLASRKLPWWIIGSAFVSTSVSSEQIVGTIGQAYKTGMAVGNWEWFTVPVYTLVIVFFIPIYLKNKISTVPELLSRRYGSFCGDFYSWTMLIAYIFIFLVPVLYGGSLAISELTGWRFGIVLWSMVILVAAYAVKGGLLSVMWTDALQCLMLVIGGVALFFAALHKIPGGWAAMAQASPERFHLYMPPSDPTAPFLAMIFATFGLFIFYSGTNQMMIQRVLGARSQWDGVMGIVFATFINFLRPLVTCFLGLVVFHWIHVMKMAPPLTNLDKAFPFALATFSPSWGLRGIVLAGFLAAVMSTISALANSIATLFALDVYKKAIDRNASDEGLIRVGRAASLLSLIIAALVAPYIQNIGIFKYFQQGVTYLATPFISVILMGIFWRRSNFPAAVFGLVGGLPITIGIAVGFPQMGIHLHWLYFGCISQVIIMTGMLIISLVTAPAPREQWEPFLWSPKLVRLLDQAATPRTFFTSWIFWYAIACVVWVYLYWRFW